MFVDREETLRQMEGLWKKPGAQLVVLYGRRRIGKTALLDHMARKYGACHWIAFRSTSADLLKDFSQGLYPFFHEGEKPDADFTYGSWKLVFEQMALIGSRQRLAVFIDEFPCAVESEPALPSLLQGLWDQRLSKTRLFLVVSGSSLSMMKDEFLRPRGPLYGRATAIIQLPPLDLAALRKVYKRYNHVQLVETYAMTGGIPKYFELISDEVPVLENIERALADRSTLLTTEPEFLLNEEFRETKLYLALLRALGRGPQILSDLGRFCGVEPHIVSRYVDRLMELQLVRRKIPVTEDPQSSRRGRYLLSDPFLNFYFRFIAPHHQDLDLGRIAPIREGIRSGFDRFIGQTVFETLCRQWIVRQADTGHLPFVPETTGSWWDRETEIDVAAVNRRDQIFLLGEAKWTLAPLGLEVLNALEVKAKRLQKIFDFHVHLALFGRSGFTEAVTNRAKQRQILLVTLEDLFQASL